MISQAADALFERLHYRATARTLVLDPKALGHAGEVIRAVFGDQGLKISDVNVLDSGVSPSPPGEPQLEAVTVGGHAELFGASREVVIELQLDGSTIVTLALGSPLPDDWETHELFDERVPDAFERLRLINALALVTYGLSGSPSTIKFVGRDVDLPGFELQDGLQLLFDDTVQTATLWPKPARDVFRSSGISQEFIGLLSTKPDRAQLRLDQGRDAFVFEGWWDRPADNDHPTPRRGHVDEVGAAVIVPGRGDGAASYRWLRRVGAAEAPVLIEADVIEGYDTLFTARLHRGAFLGDTERALAALVPGETVELPEPPASVHLVALSYAPAAGQFLTLGAGDPAVGGAHVIELADDLSLRKVKYTVRTGGVGLTHQRRRTKPKTPVEVEGLVHIFGVEFDVRGQHGSFISGRVANPREVHVGHFIQQALPVELPFGLETITLGEASIERALGSAGGATHLHLELDGKVELFPHRAVVLDAVDLLIDDDGQGTVTGSIEADFTIGPITVAAVASDQGDSWRFSGLLESSDGVSLTELVDHLAHAMGAAVPAAVPDVKLTRLALAYDTATRGLEITAESKWRVDDDVPVLAGDYDALVDLTVAKPRDRSGHTLAANARFTVTKPAERAGQPADADTFVFEAHAALSHDEQSFGFDVTATGDPLRPSTLAKGIGLDTNLIPEGVSADLDRVLEVQTLSADYHRSTQALELACTRPLGEGLLLLEFDRDNQHREVRASWHPHERGSTLGLSDLLDTVGLAGADDGSSPFAKGVQKLEEWFTFNDVAFDWNEKGGSSDLTFDAVSAGTLFHDAFVTVRGGKLVAGLAFADDQTIDQLGDVSEKLHEFIETIDKVLRVEPTCIIVSETADPSFVPPGAVPAITPEDPGSGAMRRHRAPLRLVEGLTIGAKLVIGEQSLLRRAVDLDELDATVSVGEVMALQATIPIDLKVDVGAGASLELSSPYVRVSTAAEFDIGGGLDLDLFGERLKVEGWLSLTPESLEGHLKVDDLPISMFTPIEGLPGVAIVVDEKNPLAADVGVAFEPPGLDLGVSASFAIFKDATTMVAGTATIELEIVEEVPEPLFASFELEEITIPMFFEAQYGVQYRLHKAQTALQAVEAGEQTIEHAAAKAGLHPPSAVAAARNDAKAALDAASSALRDAEKVLGAIEDILSEVEFTDARMYWCDSIVNLPDGTTATPGVGLRGGLRIFGWDAYAVLDMSTQGIPGFSGHFETEKVTIDGVLKVWGDGKGIAKPPPPKNPAAPNPEPAADGGAASGDGADHTQQWLVEPGGPVLHLSTRKAPFLYADLHAQLFDFVQGSIHASLRTDGFDFSFKVDAGNAVTADLECHWHHGDGKLETHGDLGVQLQGTIGPIVPGVEATTIELDCDLDGHMSMVVTDTEFSLDVHGTFDYEGATLHLPRISIDEKLASLEDLVAHIWHKIETEAETIFADLLGPVGKLAEEAEKKVAHIEHAAWNDAKAAAKDAKAAAEAVVAGAARLATAGVHELDKAAGAVEDEAEKVVAGAAKAAAHAAEAILHDVDRLEDEAKVVIADALAEVGRLADEAEKALDDAAHYVAHVAAEVAQWAAEAAAKAAHAVEHAASRAWHKVSSWL